MVRLTCLLSLALAAAPVAAQTPASAPRDLNPRALELFDTDWRLMDWALRQFDRNHDAILSIVEAQPALAAFKDLADGDRDGRVTTYEFDRAREFILARY